MKDLQIFNNPEFGEIRTLDINGEPWFAGKDIAIALGYVKPTDAVRKLVDSEDRTLSKMETPSGMQDMTIINESGLYSLIMSSQLPNAKKFKRWVTHEVLPSIRKTGSYDMGQTQPMTPAQLLAAQAKVLVDMEQRMDQMQGQTRALEAKVETAIRAFSRPDKDHWKEDMDKQIKEVCALYGSSIIKLKGQLYAELEQKANCNISSRLAALRRRSKKAGMRSADAAALTKLDAIAADKKLRAIFEGIVRSWQATSVSITDPPEVEGEASYEG